MARSATRSVRMPWATSCTARTDTWPWPSCDPAARSSPPEIFSAEARRREHKPLAPTSPIADATSSGGHRSPSRGAEPVSQLDRCRAGTPRRSQGESIAPKHEPDIARGRATDRPPDLGACLNARAVGSHSPYSPECVEKVNSPKFVGTAF